MATEVGFINNDKIDWFNPGSDFWADKMWENSYDDDGRQRLILKEIKESVAEFTQTTDDEREIITAQEFAAQCEEYWAKRELDETDEIGIVLSL